MTDIAVVNAAMLDLVVVHGHRGSLRKKHVRVRVVVAHYDPVVDQQIAGGRVVVQVPCRVDVVEIVSDLHHVPAVAFVAGHTCYVNARDTKAIAQILKSLAHRGTNAASYQEAPNNVTHVKLNERVFFFFVIEDRFGEQRLKEVTLLHRVEAVQVLIRNTLYVVFQLLVQPLNF